jgi:hypothetical protein
VAFVEGSFGGNRATRDIVIHTRADFRITVACASKVSAIDAA